MLLHMYILTVRATWSKMGFHCQTAVKYLKMIKGICFLVVTTLKIVFIKILAVNMLRLI